MVRVRGSAPRPPRSKRGALLNELHPDILVVPRESNLVLRFHRPSSCALGCGATSQSTEWCGTELCRSWVAGRVAGAVPHRMNDDLILCCFVEDEIGIRGRRHAPDAGIIRPHSRMRVPEQQINDAPDASLDACRSLRRTCGDVVEDRCKIGKRGKRIAQPHRPCLAHNAQTCSSLANSPRAAASLERAIASRSSTERATGAGCSEPESWMMTRAISSCSSGGRSRTASSALSRSFVMQQR